MNFKHLFSDDRAVSPVIGVILMVAITVILAAVIGTFVLGLGNKVQTSAPSASFQFDYNGSTGMTIADNGGDTLQKSNINVSASGWTINSTSYNLAASGKIQAGDTIDLVMNGNAANGDTVQVVWTAASGGKSATLGKWTYQG